jgi:hypothetical protein
MKTQSWGIAALAAIVVIACGAPLIIVPIGLLLLLSTPAPPSRPEPPIELASAETADLPDGHRQAVLEMASALFSRGIKARGPKVGGSVDENLRAAVIGDVLRGPDRDGHSFEWLLRTVGAPPKCSFIATAPGRRISDFDSPEAVVQWRIATERLPDEARKMGSDLITTAVMACQYRAQGKDFFDGKQPSWIKNIDGWSRRDGINQTSVTLCAEAGGYAFHVQVWDELDTRQAGPWSSVAVDFEPLID